MEAEFWSKVTSALEAAMDLPPEERESVLAALCKGDETLHHEVRRLLEEMQNSETFLRPLDAHEPAVAADGDILAERYLVESMIGRGGMGEVYRVFDQLMHERVALKTLRRELTEDQTSLLRFRREVQLARKVTHPCVCRVFEFGVHDDGQGGVHFFTMQFVEGETLSARLRREGPLSPEQALPLVIQMAESLDAAHKAGIIHRDFKSSNVLLSGGRAVTTDFGLARLERVEDRLGHTSITRNAQVAGTVAYMSPEQLSGEALTSKSDIYAFGIVMFEMLTARLPFEDQHIVQSAMQRAERSAPDIRGLAPEIAPEWARVIGRCLRRAPDERFQSAEEAVRGLTRRNRRVLGAMVSQMSRRQWVAAAGGIGVAALGLSFVPSLRGLLGGAPEIPAGAEVLLSPIENKTGEEQIDAVTELFRNQLAQSARATLIDDSRLNDELRQMGRAPEKVSPAVTREAAWRMGAAAAIFGAVSRPADYAMNIQLELRGSQPDAPRSKFLRSFSAPDPPGLMRAVRDATLWIRKIIGESPETIAEFDRLPENATTPSWEALALYARGQRFYLKQDYEAAILEFDHALRRDPGFTLAALRRADLLTSQDRQTEAFAQWKEAMRMLQARTVTRAEELNARGMFAYDTGDYQEADRQFKTWSLEYPADWHGSFYRSVPLILNGHAGQALELLQSLRKSVPKYGDLYAQMISCLLVLGRTEEARALVPELRKYNRPERADLRDAYCYFREGDCVRYLEVLRKVQQSKSYRRMAADAMAREAALLFDCGLPDVAAARVEAFLKAGSWAEAVPQEITLLMLQAWGESLDGRHEKAVIHSRRVLETERGPVLTYLAGSVFARAKRADLVKLALDICSENGAYPLYRLARHRVLGEAAVAQGRRDDAIREFQSAAALEPRIAHRQYLIEALPHADPARLELCLNVVRIPWQVFRPPPFHNLGSLHAAVPAVNAEPSQREPFAVKFAESSAKISRLI